MGLSNLYNKVALLSPYIEIAMRHFYWRNVDKLKKFSPNKAVSAGEESINKPANFDLVIEWLRKQGIGEGDLLIVHSGYGELEKTGLSPEQIIDRLLELVGPSGTLAMPVIRTYKELEKAKKKGTDLRGIIGKYNVKKTMVSSGMLPYTLLHRPEAIISHHPFNPLCAVGQLARDMMQHNLEGEAPSPHGPNSCWKFCLDHNAKVCSIGTDIEHHNTIMHVAEEAFGDWYWPEDVWYYKQRFEVIDEENNCKEIVVSNRKEDWGKLHIAEVNVCHAEKKAGAMRSACIEDITVGFVDPQKMINLLRKKNKKGYPYYVFPWESVNNIK